MNHFTSNTHKLKRKIINFTYKISKWLSKPERNFTADMTYGILAAGSCLPTDVVDQLHEDSKKINVVDRLSRHLDKGVPAAVASSYLQQVRKLDSSEQVIHIHDSDIIKLNGYILASLCIVHDESGCVPVKNITLQKRVSSLPVPIRSAYFQKIYSSAEKNFKSTNAITFGTVKQGASLFGKAPLHGLLL